MSAFSPVADGGASVCELTLRPTVPAPSFRDPVVVRLGRADSPRLLAADGGVRQGWIWARLMGHAVGTFVVSLALSLVFVALAPIVMGYRPVVVSSGSMAPALVGADVVVTERPDGPLSVGQVVDFRSAGQQVIHRVVGVTDTGYRTKGDANQTPDSSEVRDADVQGVGVMVIPLVGLPSLWIDQGRWPELVGLVVGLMVAGVLSSRRWSSMPGRLGPAG